MPQGRGLSVFLGEMGDLAGATSSASTKLIHGGLALSRVLRVPAGPGSAARARGAARARAAHHLAAAICPPSSRRPEAVAGDPARPLSLRPPRRATHPAADEEPRPPQGRGGKAAQARVPPRASNIRTAGSTMRASSRSMRATPPTAAPRSPPARRFVAARRQGGEWRLTLEDQRNRARFEITARALVNAAGPWVSDVVQGVVGTEQPEPDAAGQGQPHRRRAALRP